MTAKDASPADGTVDGTPGDSSAGDGGAADAAVADVTRAYADCGGDEAFECYCAPLPEATVYECDAAPGDEAGCTNDPLCERCVMGGFPCPAQCQPDAAVVVHPSGCWAQMPVLSGAVSINGSCAPPPADWDGGCAGGGVVVERPAGDPVQCGEPQVAQCSGGTFWQLFE